MRRIVVLGNGVAGLTAAEALRENGFEGELTIVGEERHAAYSRPALSKAALTGDHPAALSLPGATHGATELLGVSAHGLDMDRHVVHLCDGEDLPFDGVVLATGSRARRLEPSHGTDAPEQLTLRGLDDMTRLRARLRGRPSVVVVGGGPLGMEIASSVLDAGCAVTLVELGQPLVRHLGPYLADVLVQAALARGLQLHSGGAAELRQGDGHPEVVLGDGSVVAAEALISAIGDAPNIEWLSGSDLLSDGDLVVDSRGRVVVGGRARPDVVAAGDIATFPTGRGLRRVPLWTSAIDQAKVAGPALLRGEDAPELAFRPYFWTEQFGINVRASGHLPRAEAPEVRGGDPRDGSALLRWDPDPDHGAAVALNYRIPIPRLRRLALSAEIAAA